MSIGRLHRAGGALALLAATAIGGAALAQDAVVNLYSSRHYDTDQALYDRFTQETGIRVNLIEGDADQLIERIRAEGRNSPADVLITVDAGRLWRAEEAGLLQPVKSEVLEERIPESLRHPDGLWFGLSKRVRAIFYHERRVDPAELSTYEHLADPRWQGRICIRSSGNIYNQSMIASMIASLGVEATEAWARGLVANLARAPQGGDTDQIKAVAAGECDLAIANHYYYLRLVNSADPAEQAVAEAVGIFFPNQHDRGVHANIGGAGVLATAPHPDNAIAFLEYLTTADAQRHFALGNNEFPVVVGVEPDPLIADWGEIKTDAVNASLYGRHNAEAVRLMDRVGWR